MSGAEDPDARIAIVGGVYRERCMQPGWREIYGSAGRAASAMSSMGAPVDLHAYMDPLALGVLESRAVLEGYGFTPVHVDQPITFDYHHGLETPRIYGLGTKQTPLNVTASRIVRFGLLEGDAVVHGGQVVYDPQDAREPKPFGANGSTADQLALILNRHEATLLTGLAVESDEEVAEHLIQQESAQVVVMKLGPVGSLVHDGHAAQHIPAYKSDRVWKIGSGDNFVAHFAFHWMYERKPPGQSADLASRATAYYCQARGFATPDTLKAFKPEPVLPSAAFRSGHRPTVYLAGPFFTLAQLWLIEQARADLTAMGLKVFSPYHEVGRGSAEDVVEQDLAGIETSDILFAVGDSMDSGTIYEVGYARAKGKPVVLYCENESDESQKMMQGSDCVLCDDYVSAIYQTLWVACSL